MAEVTQEMHDDIGRLESLVSELRAGQARLEGEMIYIRRALESIESIERAEVQAALEVRKTDALERIRDHGAERNHRRELTIKALAVLTAIGTILAAILGS